MKKLIRKSSLLFSAGAFGGLINSLTVWLFGLWGINQMLGTSIAPELSPNWLYPRLIWGGLWGFAFLLLEIRKKRPSFLWSAFLISLAPTLVMLFVVFPLKAGKGYLGLQLGFMAPALVVFFNFIWAIATLWLFRYSR